MSEIILEFVGQTMGAQIFRHPVTKRSIRAGRNLAVRYASVTADELDYFLSLGVFRATETTTPPRVAVRKDAPKRIEPVFSDAVVEPVVTQDLANQNTIADETKIVSFDEEAPSTLEWMSVDNATEAVAETALSSEEVVADVAEDSSHDDDSKKVRRGRPRG